MVGSSNYRYTEELFETEYEGPTNQFLLSDVLVIRVYLLYVH